LQLGASTTNEPGNLASQYENTTEGNAIVSMLAEVHSTPRRLPALFDETLCFMVRNVQSDAGQLGRQITLPQATIRRSGSPVQDFVPHFAENLNPYYSPTDSKLITDN